MPPAFFREGLAVVLEGVQDPGSYMVKAPRDVLGTITASSGLAVDYDSAGAFTAFLIERFGMEAYLRVYGSLHVRDTVDEIDRVFTKVLGSSLRDCAAVFEAIDRGCGQPAYATKIIECEAPAIAWDGVQYAEYRELSCAQEDALGPYDGDELVILRTLEVRYEGWYELRVISDQPSTSIALQRCGGCGPGSSSEMVVASAGEAVRVELAEGLYSLQQRGNAGRATEIGVWIGQIDPPAG